MTIVRLPIGIYYYTGTIILSILISLTGSNSEQFDPYQVNGGLVAAVAGRNYCILAADTRMMDGGYQIHSRNLMRIFPLVQQLRGMGLPLPKLNDEITVPVSGCGSPVSLIAAAGCEADCNALQRRLLYQIKAHGDANDHDFGEGGTALAPKHVAQLLSTTLYSRRNFPYYSFCVVGGVDPTNGRSSVYVYDAIGSMEQVAVATAGTGRELLQPILDRLFSSSPGDDNVNGRGVVVDCTSDEAIARLIQAYHAVTERDIGVGDSLILCVLSCLEHDGESQKCRILRIPLKTH